MRIWPFFVPLGMGYSVYILYSNTFDKYYIGQSDAVLRRLTDHNVTSTKSYTVKYRPWTLVAQFEVGADRGLARKVETFIKSQKSRSFIRTIIEKGDIGFILERFTK
jgi:putative endonuclease